MFLVTRAEKYGPFLSPVFLRLTIAFAVLSFSFFSPAAAQCTVAPTAATVQPTCLVNTGTITVTSPAPATGVTYTVSGTSYNNTNATGIFTLLPPGTYSVTAKLSSGCITPALQVTFNAPSFPGTILPASATVCSNVGQVLTATAGGTAYQWYRVGTVLPLATTTVNTFTVTQTGTYYAVIISGLCSSQTSNNAVINAVPPPSGSISPTGTVTVCAGNSVTLTATGGGTYQWYLNNNLQSVTTATFPASQAGTYSVVISNGVCSAPASNTTTVAIAAAPTGTITPANASICAGSSQLLTVSGGASYQWYMDNVAISGATASTYPATQAGTYSVDIISSTGCKAKASNNATVNVTPLPSGSIAPASVTICSGGTATLTAMGGVSYQWYVNGAQTSVTSATFSATAAGNYAVDIFDAGGCKGKSSNESIVAVTPTPTGAIAPATATVCPGDSVKLTASGGGTSYQWYRNGTLLANETSSTYNAKLGGNYTVDIFNGICKGSATNTAAITLGTIPTGTISPAAGSLCSGNSIVLTATGGTSYQWALNGAPITGATSATHTATQTGTYTVTINNGTCKGPASNSVVISPSTAIGFNTASTDPSCTATAGTITVSGSTGGTGSGYTYSKDNGTNFQTSNVFSGLAPGTYEIVVKDAAGCKSTSKTVVINAFASTLAATFTTTNITCTQAAGTVTVTASGGTPPYQYSLDGNATFQTSNNFNSLPSGAHRVTVKDAAGCLRDVTFTITQIQSTLAAVASTVTNASCGQANGAATIQATGGTGSYTYSLDNGTFGAGSSFGSLAVAVHKVTVKDGAGCTYDVSFEVKQLFGIPNLVVTNPAKICPGATANLQAAAVTTGSDAGLTYTYWRDANATAQLSTPAVTEGTYYIRAVNGGGCFSIKPVVVTAQAVFPGSITFTRTTACFTDSLPLTASGGVSYQWLRDDTPVTGATRIQYEAKESGLYSVLISDGTCAVKASNTVRLEFKACTPIFDPRVFVPTAFTPNRNGMNDVLRPIFYNITTLTYFKVYNRWGQQVFATATAGKGWDGTKDGIPQPPETYSWILECVGKNGEVVKQSGRSLLIR